MTQEALITDYFYGDESEQFSYQVRYEVCVCMRAQILS